MSKYLNREWRGLYKTQRWYRLRYKQLQANPCCKYCEDQGLVVLATVVDHKIRHKGDEDLFFDPDNLQSLCKQHHDSTKQREEFHGVVLGCNENGYPVDSSHHWYK